MQFTIWARHGISYFAGLQQREKNFLPALEHFWYTFLKISSGVTHINQRLTKLTLLNMVSTFKMNSKHQSQRKNQLHRKQSSKWCRASHANFVTQLVVHADKQILLSNAVTSVGAANIVRTLMHQCHKTFQKTWRKMWSTKNLATMGMIEWCLFW